MESASPRHWAFQSLIGICVSCNRRGGQKWRARARVSIPNRDLCKLQHYFIHQSLRINQFQSLIGICVSCNLLAQLELIPGPMFQSLIGICVSCNGKSASALNSHAIVSIPNRDLCKLQLFSISSSSSDSMFQSLIGICVSCNLFSIISPSLAQYVSIPNRDLCKLQHQKFYRRPDRMKIVSIPNRDLCKLQQKEEEKDIKLLRFQSLIGICVSCNFKMRSIIFRIRVSIPNRDLCKLQL